MIQRIQTLFLLGVALAIGSIYFFPFAISTKQGSTGIFSDQVLNLYDNGILTFGVPFIITLAIVNIFLFSNRKIQMRNSTFIAVACLLLVLGVVFVWFEDQGSFLGEHTQLGIGMFMPLLSIILSILSYRAIKKDEETVQSMDRLR